MKYIISYFKDDKYGEIGCNTIIELLNTLKVKDISDCMIYFRNSFREVLIFNHSGVEFNGFINFNPNIYIPSTLVKGLAKHFNINIGGN